MGRPPAPPPPRRCPGHGRHGQHPSGDPRIDPTASSASIGSPSSSHSPANTRFPTACPAKRPGAAVAVLEQAGQPLVVVVSWPPAHRAMRRSPGGRMPSSRRSRPDEPPSSATVTTAVTWSATSRPDLERGRQSVSASEATSDGIRGASCRSWPHHSRPRSRCRMWTSTASDPTISRRGTPRSRRCEYLPPVHPAAIVM